MSDLAPRPRGGWQVGSHFGRRDPCVPSGDCYGVVWSADRSQVTIRHYHTQDEDTACCIREVTRRAGESDAAMLDRVYPPFALCARPINGGEQ